MLLTFTHFFDASHQLTDSPELYTKKCAQLHGHTYQVVLQIEAPIGKAGMVIDFGTLKHCIDTLVDHKHLNKVFEIYNFNGEPTAENIAVFIKHQLEKRLHLEIISVELCEGYKGDHSPRVKIS